MSLLGRGVNKSGRGGGVWQQVAAWGGGERCAETHQSLGEWMLEGPGTELGRTEDVGPQQEWGTERAADFMGR